MSEFDKLITTDEEDRPDEQYPPKGEPHTAIIINLCEDQYAVVAHTGRFFHAQCVCAGFQGEEIGVSDVPTDPGVWYFKGTPWNHTDWETGYVDDCGIAGTFRKATPQDFRNAGLECPMEFSGEKIIEGAKEALIYAKNDIAYKRMREAMQLFVDRVEAGEVRSVLTYTQFKKILEDV